MVEDFSGPAGRLLESSSQRAGWASAVRRQFGFPNPVNEVSARLVALGVLVMAVGYVASGWTVLLLALAYGFVARVLSGPRFSPLGLLVTRVVTPYLGLRPRLVPGPPKRFAQGIGATFSLSAVVLAVAFDQPGVARLLIGALACAAALEAALGLCLGCKVFGFLMRIGVIPPEICVSCNDIGAAEFAQQSNCDIDQPNRRQWQGRT